MDEWTPIDRDNVYVGMHVRWEKLLDNERFEGTVVEIDNNVLYVNCTDGVQRCVET